MGRSKMMVLLWLSVLLCLGNGVLAANLSEDFEGGTFVPTDWAEIESGTDPNDATVDHGYGQDGSGDNTAAGHGLLLNDNNSDGYCQINSPAYNTTNLRTVEFDFAYQSGTYEGISFIFDTNPGSGFGGPFIVFESGKIYYYDTAFFKHSITVNGSDMTISTTGGEWQRAVFTIVDGAAGTCVLAVTDIAGATTQVSDPFSSYRAYGPDGKMVWWTTAAITVGFSIDNVTTTTDLLDEDFEGATFVPDGWDDDTDSNTWVNHGIGHDGSGGDTASGHGLALDDYNASGSCGVDSPTYETTGVVAAGFDFSYQVGSGAVYYTFDTDSSASFSGPYIRILNGVIQYYNNSTWTTLTVGEGDIEVDTSGDWHTLLISPSNDLDDTYIMTLTNVTDSTVQVTDEFTSVVTGGINSKMSWWTDTSSNIGFNIDNVITQRRYTTDNYSLVFHKNGAVDVYDFSTSGEVIAGTLGDFSCAGCGVYSNSMPVEISLDTANEWPEVDVDYLMGDGSLSATWKLMPKMAHVKFTAEARSGYTPDEDGEVASVDFEMDDPDLDEIAKPAYWIFVDNTAPAYDYYYQLTSGMAAEYTTDDDVTLILANDKGLEATYSLCDSDEILIYAEEDSDEYIADATISFDTCDSALQLAVAESADESLMMNVMADGDHPFYLWDSNPITLTAEIVNLHTSTLTTTLTATAYDYDGNSVTVTLGDSSESLDPLELWEVSVSLSPSEAGPVWLKLEASHSEDTITQNIKLGLLPSRSFTGSRFGISGYRQGVSGSHTSARTESQLQDLMYDDLGVRGLRMSTDHSAAHTKGFYTWYACGISATDNGGDDYDTVGEREYWVNSWLAVADNLGASCYEFGNEWNSAGGELNATYADEYAEDWIPIIKSIRDTSYTSVDIAGLTLANGDYEYMEVVYDEGGWDDFELLSFHAMGVPRSCDFDNYGTYWSYLLTLREIYESIRKYGSKELWMTEYYAPTAPNGSTSFQNERVAAEEITLQTAIAMAARLDGLMFHCLDDYDYDPDENNQGIPTDGIFEIKTATAYGSENSERECYFGLLTRDWMPKASLWAYQTAAYYFDDAIFLGDVVMDDPGQSNDQGLAFSSSNGDFLVLWSRKEGYLQNLSSSYDNKLPWLEFWENEYSVTFDLDDDPETNLEVYNAIGQDVTPTPLSGQVTINLTGAPVYVFGVDFETESGRFAKLFYGDDVDEDFEGATFVPDDWSTITNSSTWVNHYYGHDGSGGNTASGHGLSLDDYNSSPSGGYCMATSPEYETVGLSTLAFDFVYHAATTNYDHVYFNGNISPSRVIYLEIAYGTMHYYDGSSWNDVECDGVDIEVNTDSGEWQRLWVVDIEPDGDCKLVLEDVTTGDKQYSDTISSYTTTATEYGEMSWWTGTTYNIDFGIDNVRTAAGLLSEDFEESTFFSEGWTKTEAASTSVEHSYGQDGDGDNTASGHGVLLEDENSSGYCQLESPAYKYADGDIEFEFAYQSGTVGTNILFYADADPSDSFSGPYLSIANGKIQYYNSGWYDVEEDSTAITVDTTAGEWQRVIISPTGASNTYVLTLIDIDSDTIQASDSFTSETTGGTNSKMCWWTDCSDDIYFSIDNVKITIP